jgi:ornithine decarboxylase
MCRFSCKFGCSVDEMSIRNILSVCQALHLHLDGVSFHVGSGCQSITSYEKAIKDAASIFEIAEKYGYMLRILDIGGGFPGTNSLDILGVEYERSSTKLSFEDIALAINQSIESNFSRERLDNMTIIAEPGRFFVSGSHTLCLNVISKKERYNQEKEAKEFTYYMNEGVYGSFNCIFFDHAQPEVYPYNERDGTTFSSTVFGPTCDSMDIIHQNLELPELAIGEWCFVPNFGAYTSAAASNFNGFQKTKCFYVFQYLS